MSRRFLTADDVRRSGGPDITVDTDTVVTPQALEVAESMGISIRTSAGAYSEPAPDRGPDVESELSRLSHRPEPEAEAGGGGDVIVTAVGCNRPGVLGELSAEVGKHNASVRDVSQKTLGEYFHLVLIVELAPGAEFSQMKSGLEELGRQKQYVVRVMHERVFRYMHRV
jgi:ACT domain-containing protein